MQTRPTTPCIRMVSTLRQPVTAETIGASRKNMEFIKALLTGENAVTLGVGLFLVGIIYYFSPRILGQHVEACNGARRALKQEALQLGQNDRFNRLTKEEKGISKLPLYSKTMMATGLCIIVAAVIWRLIK